MNIIKIQKSNLSKNKSLISFTKHERMALKKNGFEEEKNVRKKENFEKVIDSHNMRMAVKRAKKKRMTGKVWRLNALFYWSRRAWQKKKH